MSNEKPSSPYCVTLYYVRINSKLAHPPPPPPPGIPRAFDPLPCPGRGEFDGPQRTWGGAFDHNTTGVGNLICRLDFMFRAALRIKTAHVCLQMLKQPPYPSVIIGELIFKVTDITILFVTSGKTMETDISAQITFDFRRKSRPEVGHLTTEFSLDVGHLNGFLARGGEFDHNETEKFKCASFELISTLLGRLQEKCNIDHSCESVNNNCNTPCSKMATAPKRSGESCTRHFQLTHHYIYFLFTNFQVMPVVYRDPLQGLTSASGQFHQEDKCKPPCMKNNGTKWQWRLCEQLEKHCFGCPEIVITCQNKNHGSTSIVGSSSKVFLFSQSVGNLSPVTVCLLHLVWNHAHISALWRTKVSFFELRSFVMWSFRITERNPLFQKTNFSTSSLYHSRYSTPQPSDWWPTNHKIGF